MHTYTLEGAHPYTSIHLGLQFPHLILPQQNSHIDQLIVWDLETGECKTVDNQIHRSASRLPSINDSHTVVHRKRDSHEKARFNDIFATMQFRMHELAEKGRCQNVPAPAIDNDIDDDPEMAKSLLTTASGYARKNKQQSAIESFENALCFTKNADDYKKVCEFFENQGTKHEKELALLYLAVLYYKEENFVEAGNALSKSQEFCRSTKAVLLYADFLHSQGNDRHAVGYYQTAALSLEPRPKERVEVMRKIVCCEPDNPDHYEGLANFYSKEKSKFWIYLLALVHFAEKNDPVNYVKFLALANEKEPHNPLVEIILISLKEKLHDLGPETENRLCTAAGDKLMRKNRHEEARHYFTRASKRKADEDFEHLIICEEFSPDAVHDERIIKTYKNWVEACEEREDVEKAVEIYEQVLSRFPNNAEMHLKYLYFLLRLNDPLKTETILREISWCNENLTEENKSRSVTVLRVDINLELADHPEEPFFRDLISGNHEPFSTFLEVNALRRLYQGWINHHCEKQEYPETIALTKVAIERFPNHVPYRLHIAKLIFKTKNTEEVPYFLDQVKWLDERKVVPEARERVCRLFGDIFTSVKDEGLDAFNINLITANGGLFRDVFFDCDYPELFQSLFSQYIDKKQPVEAMEIARLGYESFPEHINFRREVFAFTYEQKETELAQIYHNSIVENCRAILEICEEEEIEIFLEQLHEILIDLDLAQELASIHTKKGNLERAGHIYLETGNEAALKTDAEQLEACIRAIDNIGISECNFEPHELSSYVILENFARTNRELSQLRKQQEQIQEQILNIIDQLPQPGWLKQTFDAIRAVFTWKKPEEEKVN